MRLKKVFIVERPKTLSAIEDVCYGVDWLDLQRQFAGGLHAGDILAVYDNGEEAREHAQKALEEMRS